MGYFSFDVGVLNKLAYHSQTLTRLKQYILIYIYILAQQNVNIAPS